MKNVGGCMTASRSFDTDWDFALVADVTCIKPECTELAKTV